MSEPPGVQMAHTTGILNLFQFNKGQLSRPFTCATGVCCVAMFKLIAQTITLRIIQEFIMYSRLLSKHEKFLQRFKSYLRELSACGGAMSLKYNNINKSVFRMNM